MPSAHAEPEIWLLESAQDGMSEALVTLGLSTRSAQQASAILAAARQGLVRMVFVGPTVDDELRILFLGMMRRRFGNVPLACFFRRSTMSKEKEFLALGCSAVLAWPVATIDAIYKALPEGALPSPRSESDPFLDAFRTLSTLKWSGLPGMALLGTDDSQLPTSSRPDQTAIKGPQNDDARSRTDQDAQRPARVPSMASERLVKQEDGAGAEAERDGSDDNDDEELSAAAFEDETWLDGTGNLGLTAQGRAPMTGKRQPLERLVTDESDELSADAFDDPTTLDPNVDGEGGWSPLPGEPEPDALIPMSDDKMERTLLALRKRFESSGQKKEAEALDRVMSYSSDVVREAMDRTHARLRSASSGLVLVCARHVDEAFAIWSPFADSRLRAQVADRMDQALKLATASQIDAVICTEHFADGHWATLLGRLRQPGLTARLPLFLFFDQCSPAFEAEALDAGVEEVFTPQTPSPVIATKIRRSSQGLVGPDASGLFRVDAEDVTPTGALGRLEDRSLMDLVMGLTDLNQTASVQILGGQGVQGEVILVAGQVTFARTGALSAADAFFHLCRVDSGTFAVNYQVQSHTQQSVAPTTALLAEALRRSWT